LESKAEALEKLGCGHVAIVAYTWGDSIITYTMHYDASATTFSYTIHVTHSQYSVPPSHL